MKINQKKLGIWVISLSLCLTTWVGTERVYAEEPSPSTEPSPSPEQPKDDVNIALSEESIEIEVGKSKEVTATVTGGDGSDTSVTWKVLKGSEAIKITTDNTKITVEGVQKGTAEISATANADGKATTTLKVTVKEKEPEKSTDATLKSLKIVNATLDPDFSPETFEYTITSTSSNRPYIDEKGTETNDPKATKKINASADGSSFEVVVTAEDGKTTKTYKITKKTEESTSVNLKSLKVNGYSLNEAFSSSRTNYTLEIPYEAEDVSIEVGKEDDRAKVSITGASGLKVGKNEVKITVQNTSGNSKVYTITVTRAAKEENTSEEEKATSSSLNQTSNITDATIDENEDGRSNHTLQYILVSIGCLILFLIGGLGIYFYFKTSVKDEEKKKKEKDKKQEKDGKEEPKKEPIKELEKTREFTDLEKAAENKKRALENNEAVNKEIEDLFDDE